MKGWPYEGMINCTDAVKLSDIGEYLYKAGCKWENKISEKKANRV
jgi:hypothetical protein